MNNDTPNFFKVGNLALYIGGWFLVILANVSVFVLGGFINLLGIIFYSTGIILLYLNYTIVKDNLEIEK
jgi:hypothetical protein